MIDTTLLDTLKIMAKREKKVKEYKRRIRIKGKLTKKSLTKNKNIKLTIKKGENEFSFIVLKSHVERYSLAERLKINSSVYAEGISKFRMIICTKLKSLLKEVDESEQMRLKESD